MDTLALLVVLGFLGMMVAGFLMIVFSLVLAFFEWVSKL